MKKEWVVLKFGGTSVANVANWDNIETIIQSRLKEGTQPFVVLSAFAGVSNLLAKIVQGNEEASSIIQDIKEFHLKKAEELGLKADELLAPLFDQLDQLTGRVLAKDGAEPALEAKIMALGELMATTLAAKRLNERGINVELVDARTILQAETVPGQSARRQFLSAACSADKDPALGEKLAVTDKVILTQGFIARNTDGQDVLLGRGGSDTSAAFFAAKLGAVRLEIWTDVPGIFTADPKIVSGARLLKELPYREAQEIASMGGSVLHPRCIRPVQRHGIPIQVFCTQKPDFEGTLISVEADCDAPSVKAISSRPGTVLISMETSRMWHQVGFLADVFRVFSDLGLSIDLVSTAETNVTVTLDTTTNLLDATVLDHLYQKLEEHCRVKILEQTTVISLIGNKIRALLHEIGPALEVFKESPIYLLSQAASDLNLSFVIDEDRAQNLIKQLHQMLIRPKDTVLFGPTVAELNQEAYGEAVPPAQWWRTKKDQLIDIAHTHGASYVYDTATVDVMIKKLAALKNIDRFFYAMKANNNARILERVYEGGFGFECVSQGEINRVLELFPKIDRQRILFTPNFAPREEYEKALGENILVTIDNLFPLQEWGEIFKGRNIILRLDPDYGSGHHKHVRTGGVFSKFGIPLTGIEEALELISANQATLIALHAHVGSGIMDPANWAKLGETLLEIAGKIPTIKALNLGGGLGVAEHAHEAPLDLMAVDTSLAALKKQRPDIALWLEPGRFLVAEAGVLIAKVTQTKRKEGAYYVGLETGMNSLIRPALYGSYHEIVNLSRIDQPGSEVTTIVGPICESGDRLGSDRLLPPCRQGDVILIANTGAYGAVMSSSYNLRAPAGEIAI